MRQLLLGVAAMSLAAPAHASDTHGVADRTVLDPAGPWSASYDDGLCRLSRVFGPEGNRHALAFEQVVPTSTIDMTIAGAAVSGFNSKRETTVQLNDLGSSRKGQPVLGEIEGFGDAIMFERLDFAAGSDDADTPASPVFGQGLDLASAATYEYLSVAHGDREIVLLTGNLRDAFHVLNDCTSHMLESWGLDSKEIGNAASGARLTDEVGLSQRLVQGYPLRALQNNEQGRVGLLAKVSERGKVDDCRVVYDSGSPTLNKAACKGLRSSEFQPAVDAAGQPIASFYSIQITYRLN